MHVSTATPAHEVLRSERELETLSNNWISQNKSRVHARMRKFDTLRTEAATPVTLQITSSQAVSDLIAVKSDLIKKSKPSPYVLASLKNVFASRKDLAPDVTTNTATTTYPYTRPSLKSVPAVCINSDTFAKNESMYATAMGVTENGIMTRVCDTFLHATQPYSSGNRSGNKANIPIASTCCAHITTAGSCVTRKIYLPISAPCIDQVEKCNESTSYNHNVQKNIATALSAENVNVVICTPLEAVGLTTASATGPATTDSDTKTTESHTKNTEVKSATNTDRDAVYIDPTIPVQALATPQVLQDLLFGDARITSSADFAVGNDSGETYGVAADAFLQYGNTRISKNITLTPSFFKRVPVVVSMSCPQLNMSQLVTSFSGVRNNEKFGPNHSTRLVEVMAKLVPFVNKCCEAQMGLDPETVEDLVEDRDMPIATSGNIEHCFSHNPQCGVSAYVGHHTFILPTSILNTHAVKDKTNSEHTQFPLEKRFIVHVSALFAGPVVTVEK